jgi:hypothetical protein
VRVIAEHGGGEFERLFYILHAERGIVPHNIIAGSAGRHPFQMISTLIRVPRTIGLPPRMAGSETMRSNILTPQQKRVRISVLVCTPLSKSTSTASN